jgi:glutamate/tyrosine decarboxylase-like PLP-dependent enzyme
MTAHGHESPVDRDRVTAYADAIEQTSALALAYLNGLPERPLGRPSLPATMTVALDEPLPEEPAAGAAVVADWLRRADPGIVASAGPRYFGYVVGGVTPAALAGDWLATAIDQCGGLWATSPAAAQTELVVLRWLKELFDLPRQWAGTLTSGATIGNLIGLAAARQWAGERLGFDPAGDGLAGHPAIPVIASTAVHASAVKALGTLGLGRESVRRVDAPDGRIDLAGLRARLAAIDGPAIVIANAGEVNTGQYDDLASIVDLCRHGPGGVWLHVDGAFGLIAAASPRFRPRMAGIEHADSVAGDGHKWLNLPYDSGFAFVRDPAALRAAFAATGAYLSGDGGWDADDYGPEMSRRFRGLAAWCALRAYGRAGHCSLVERCVDHAVMFAAWVSATPGLELMNADRMAVAPLNIVCFRYAPTALDDDARDVLNREAVVAIQTDGRVFVTGTTWNGRAAIRAAFVNWATTRSDVEVLQTVVGEVGARIRRPSATEPL